MRDYNLLNALHDGSFQEDIHFFVRRTGIRMLIHAVIGIILGVTFRTGLGITWWLVAISAIIIGFSTWVAASLAQEGLRVSKDPNTQAAVYGILFCVAVTGFCTAAAVIGGVATYKTVDVCWWPSWPAISGFTGFCYSVVTFTAENAARS